ncbi:Sphingosine kinase [Alteracholeplasma palmae J233]|uniref:Sphingosine kinase n=1 Tax=Alteracholeplasma palmae (strain ATCC 49389 / J233) TaxID=1318466 RepID=U4KJN3_ALTPJ|nr:YegS/Rv2252/BmrU family lipid kinase [Alteracholeplasma palmae]CCV63739.1 Sphingosine kinase [Alteracholeplasma palmae J233]
MKALLIYNPVSGKGNSAKRLDHIKKYFENEKWTLDIHASKSAEDIIEVSYNHANIYELYLVLGGDGTISNVVNGMMKSDIRPKLLVLPTGTANDFASILGIKKSKIDETLNLIKEDSYRKMDIYKANDKFFTYAAAIGKFTDVSYDIKRRTVKRFGHFAYVLKGLSDILTKAKFNVKITLDDNTTYETTSFLLFVLSARRVAGFNFKKFGDHIKLNDGKLEIVVFKRRHFLSWIKFTFVYLRKGKISKKDIRLSVSSANVNITPINYKWNLDGEYGFDGCAKLLVVNEAIEVYATPKAIKKYFI